MGGSYRGRNGHNSCVSKLTIKRIWEAKMHNSPIRNVEFQQAFCETNLRYLLGEDQTDPEIIRRIKFMKEEIVRLERLKEELCGSN